MIMENMASEYFADDEFNSDDLMNAIEGTAPLILALVDTIQRSIADAEHGHVTGKPQQLINGIPFVAEEDVEMTSKDVEASLLVGIYNQLTDYGKREMIGFAMTAVALLIRLAPLPHEIDEERVEQVLASVSDDLDSAIGHLAGEIKEHGVAVAIKELGMSICNPADSGATQLIAMSTMYRLAMQKLEADR
jgi:hypothetical protein